MRLRPGHRNHVWTYDIEFDRMHNGRPLQMLTVVDEYSRVNLAIDVGRQPLGERLYRKLQRQP